MRRQFNAALDMMNTAVEGQAVPLPTAAGPAGAFASRWATGSEAEERPAAGPGSAAAAAAAADLSLRALVERFAEEHSVQFMPKFGRFQDGMQVRGTVSRFVVVVGWGCSCKSELLCVPAPLYSPSLS